MSSDHDRRIANVIRVGVIHELDEAHAEGPRVTVDLGEQVTAWLPWLTLRAGADREWSAPEPGEQVLVLAPSGELSQGFVLAGVYSDEFPANGDRRTLRRTTYADGTVVEYDREAHQLTVDATESNGHVVVNTGTGSVTINCGTATVNAAEAVQVTTKKATVDASVSVDVTTAAAKVKATTVTLDAPITTCKGALVVDGALTWKGGMTGSGGGGATITGSINVTQAVTANSVSGTTVTAGGISLTTHKHQAQGATAITGPALA